jgi:prepilin-type N-terminal cleavage/methylation domain-containing protein
MFSNLSQKAFSLVELMVVISIIGVVSAVSLSSVTTIQKNNRDAQRQSDLRLIQGALQQYYADANHYPDSLTLTSSAAFTCPTGCGISAKTYLNRTPTDPTPGTTTPYCYAPFKSTALAACAAGQCHYYQLDAKLESPNGSTTYTCGGNATYNFQVTPL